MHLDDLPFNSTLIVVVKNEQFIKIKQAYEDLKIGKKYPETDIEKLKILEYIQVIQKQMLEEKIRF